MAGELCHDKSTEEGGFIPSAQPVSGVVVFDEAMHLQFADQPARALLAEADEFQTPAQRGLLPFEIVRLGAAIHDDGWGSGSRRRPRQRTIRTPWSSLRLRAFGVSTWREMLPEFIMVLIERRATRRRLATGEKRRRFPLTTAADGARDGGQGTKFTSKSVA